MKLLLDTTYLLPAIGISVKGIPRDAVLKLLQANYEIYINDITIFEISAKGAKYIIEERLIAERVSKGIRSIVYDEKIKKTRIHETPTLHIAFKLRRLLSDFIDCIITSSALNTCNTLITEDEDILGITEEKSFQEILRTVNPEFKIHTIKEIL